MGDIDISRSDPLTKCAVNETGFLFKKKYFCTSTKMEIYYTYIVVLDNLKATRASLFSPAASIVIMSSGEEVTELNFNGSVH